MRLRAAAPILDSIIAQMAADVNLWWQSWREIFAKIDFKVAVSIREQNLPSVGGSVDNFFDLDVCVAYLKKWYWRSGKDAKRSGGDISFEAAGLFAERGDYYLSLRRLSFFNPLFSLTPSGKPRAKRRERMLSSFVEIKRKAQSGCRQLCFYENKTIGGKLYDSEVTNEKNLWPRERA